MYCWYLPDYGMGEAIKRPRNSRQLHDGYMNAEYSDQMKFAISWEASGHGKDMAYFNKKNVMYTAGK